MVPLANIITAISPTATIRSVSESSRDYTVIYNAGTLDVNKQDLTKELAAIAARDSFILAFSAASSETAFSLSSATPEKIEAFLQQLGIWNDAFLKIDGTFKLRIGKSSQRKTLSIYSLSAFSEHICRGTPADILGKLSDLADTAYYLECYEIDKVTKSTQFSFGPKIKDGGYPVSPEASHKVKHIELRSKACSIYSNIKVNHIPSDFIFDTNILGRRLDDLFSKLSLLYSLMAIADITKIDSTGEISFTIKGYTTEKLSITSISDVDITSIEQYHSVYQWAYTEGNIIDKLGICRNLLTIHAESGNVLKLKQGWLESIASSHAIYLKDNLKQYVDLKNKLSDQIQKGSEKASDVAKSITTYLRTSIFSLTSFLLSAFLVRTLAKPTPTESAIITPGVYWLFLLIVGISLLILIYALTETNSEKFRYIKSYKAFKSRHTDLLSKEDINLIFNNDKDFFRDIRYIRSARKKAVILWICSLIVMTIIVTTMKIKGL